MKNLKFYSLSECAITIEWDHKMSIVVYEQIACFNLLLNEHPFTGFTETVPAYNSITVFYQPELMITFDKSPTVFVKRHIEKLIAEKSIPPALKKNYVSIPVCYDEEFGPDLPYISETKGISVQQVIATHQQKDYHVYMMGFLPGFSYMGEVDDTIAVARKASPRAVIEKGSVGIAGNQTGIYPLSSPGGWQIIGRTPCSLFDVDQEDPFFFKTGDTVHFESITKEEFYKYKEKENSVVVEEEEKDTNVIVRKAGVYSTFQDNGRFGFRSYGVPESGAMDTYSHNIANALVGNEKNCATIECTMGGLCLEFKINTVIAITGAGIVLINGISFPLYQPHNIALNDVVEIRFNNKGIRTYLAVQGGFGSKVMMNSRSASPKINIGTTLKKDMGLRVEKSKSKQVLNKIDKLEIPVFESHKTIRIIDGNEIDWINKESIQQFYTEQFALSNRYDRMGYLLEGKPIYLENKVEMLSSAVVKGTIQLTPSGQLIVLMNDCQTTGGYPRIGQIAAIDLWVMAQLKQGETIHFKRISFEEAEELYLTQQKTIDGYFS